MNKKMTLLPIGAMTSDSILSLSGFGMLSAHDTTEHTSSISRFTMNNYNLFWNSTSPIEVDQS
ncbi:MAG: hypothetical protein OER78_00475 [Nitrosopumilus sp.]|nr:hypothetical protein [Nitrosopumilus sp.]